MKKKTTFLFLTPSRPRISVHLIAYAAEEHVLVGQFLVHVLPDDFVDQANLPHPLQVVQHDPGVKALHTLQIVYNALLVTKNAGWRSRRLCYKAVVNALRRLLSTL